MIYVQEAAINADACFDTDIGSCQRLKVPFIAK